MRIRLKAENEILDTAFTDKGRRINALSEYFEKDRQPPLTEQLYDTVTRSDIYKERLAEISPSVQEKAETVDNAAIEESDENGSQFGVNYQPAPVSQSDVSPNQDKQDIIPLSDVLEPSGISLDTVDVMLRTGGGDKNSVVNIAAFYMKDKTPAENTEFLKQEYKKGCKGLRINGERFSMWYDESGVTFAEGPTALNALKGAFLTWEQVGSRIRELLYNGQYIMQFELDYAREFERKELANQICHIRGDTADDYQFFMDDELFRGGYPEATARVAEMLTNPEQLEYIIDGLQDFCDEYEQDREIMRFHHYNLWLYR
jgi:hypothetical protein